PEHVRLRLRVPVQRRGHGGRAGRDHRGLRLPPLGGRAGNLQLDGEASMSTSNPTHDTAAPTGRRRADAKRSSQEHRTGARDAGRKPTTTILVTAILAIVAIYFLVPVYWVVINATKSTEDLFGSNGFWFGESFQLWENLKSVLTANGGIFPRIGSVVATYFAVAAGYALAKYRFPGRRFIYVLVLGGVLVPGTAVALPLFFLFSSIGITNTYWSVLIPSLVSPFGLFLASI